MGRARHRWLFAILAAILVLSGEVFCQPAYGARTEPTLRFDLTTADAVTDLKQGDQVEVQVGISRADGLAEAYQLYSIMLDIDFDNELFEVTETEKMTADRPDGASWIGSWNCRTVPAGGTDKRVRVLYMNMTGLMSTPPVLDTVSGALNAGTFVLTAKQDVRDVESRVTFSYTENGGPDASRGPSVVGSELTLRFAPAQQGDKTEGGGSEDSGSNTGGGGSGAGGFGGGSGNASGSPAGSDAENSTSPGNVGDSAQGRQTVHFEDFTDISDSHWAAESVRYLTERGVVSGNGKKEFQPEKPLNRAEFAQMIASAFQYEPKAEAAMEGFEDVRAEDWYFRPVTALHHAGIVSGTGPQRFGAGDTLSRQDMMVILSRVVRDRGVSLAETRDYISFSDQSQVADYAREAVMELYRSGIVSGTGPDRLSPLESSTRAQAAVVLSQILKVSEEGR